MTDAGGIAGDRLHSFVKRIENLNGEIKDLTADRKEVFDEAKGEGFDSKILKMIIRRRALSQEERDTEDWALDAYEHALAGWDGTPLGEAAAHKEAAE